MQPVTTSRASSPFTSASDRTVSIDSWRASSMKAQVLTTTRSASAGSDAATRPSAARRPTSLSESTEFFGHPSVSIQYRRDMASQRYRPTLAPPQRRTDRAREAPACHTVRAAVVSTVEAMATSPAISVSGLVKTFGHVRALDGLDLTVDTGEVHGFIGPNGAGKSTTIRILLGLLRADAGEVRLLDGDPWADAVDLHRRLAYVPGDVNLWPNLSGGEVIDL